MTHYDYCITKLTRLKTKQAMDSLLADKLQAYVKDNFAHGLQVIIMYTLVPLTRAQQ